MNIKGYIVKNKYYLLAVLFCTFIAVFFVLKKKGAEKQGTEYKEQTEKKKGQEDKDIFVRVFRAKKIEFKDSIDGLFGTVKGSSFEVKSSQDEKVIKYLYKRGDYVKKGVLIAELDHTRTKSKLRQAELAYDRAQRLFEVGGATKFQVEEAWESMNIAKKDYEDTFLTAPDNGYVGEIFVQEGELASRQAPVFAFVSSQKDFRIETSIIEKKISLVHIGHNVKINIPAITEEEIDGTVLSIDPEATSVSRMVPVSISIPRKYMDILKPGLSARLSICIYETNNIIIPKSSVVEDKSSVYVVNEEKKAMLRKVVLGYQARDYVEVLKGLNEGELVIVDYMRSGVAEGSSVVYNTPTEYKEEEDKE